jgi:hypothetical protein
MAKTVLKEAVPELGSYEALEAQFQWLVDGAISHFVRKNLGSEIQNLELFLR